MAHALMENRNGMLTDFQVSQATGTAERETVPVLLDQARERRFHPKTMGGGKNYDAQECVAAIRERGVTFLFLSDRRLNCRKKQGQTESRCLDLRLPLCV